MPAESVAYAQYPLWKRMLRLRARDLPRVARKMRDLIVRDEFTNIYSSVQPFTMLNHSRARALYDGVRRIVADDVPGDIVECGTARGGSAALMALTLKRLRQHRPDRKILAFDTFDGLPPPSADDPDYEIARYWTGQCRGDLDDVRALFRELGVADITECIKGLFQETLPRSQAHPIALLHLDGDWYESIRVCLENLWDRVSPCGIVQIDDYGAWAGARKAVDEFLSTRKLSIRLRYIDPTGRQITKINAPEI
jgi:predicted O-methyltransferase YrrM